MQKSNDYNNPVPKHVIFRFKKIRLRRKITEKSWKKLKQIQVSILGYRKKNKYLTNQLLSMWIKKIYRAFIDNLAFNV